jgi:hypothetical protein
MVATSSNSRKPEISHLERRRRLCRIAKEGFPHGVPDPFVSTWHSSTQDGLSFIYVERIVITNAEDKSANPQFMVSLGHRRGELFHCYRPA